MNSEPWIGHQVKLVVVFDNWSVPGTTDEAIREMARNVVEFGHVTDIELTAISDG